MTFKQLGIGQSFIFAAERKFLGMVKGPWIKISARKYVEDTRPGPSSQFENQVGSINVEVELQN